MKGEDIATTPALSATAAGVRITFALKRTFAVGAA
jgi:hypothetical protein